MFFLPGNTLPNKTESVRVAYRHSLSIPTCSIVGKVHNAIPGLCKPTGFNDQNRAEILLG